MTAAPAAQSVGPATRTIVMTGPSIPSIFADTKTQTRRLLRNQEEMNWGDVSPALLDRCPYGRPGDRLWVKETHAQFAVGNRTGVSPQCVAYRATCDADGRFEYVNNGDEVMRLKVTKWTPAIYMPRWASRLTLELTEVRVQLVQAISEDDARAEGMHPGDAGDANLGGTARGAFVRRWDESARWAANPWVWALTFRRVP